MPAAEEPAPVALEGPALFDTGVWSWVRDRRFPELARWFNGEVAAGRVLVCDLVTLELVRAAPNPEAAAAVADRLASFESLPMGTTLWQRARELQLALAPSGGSRRVPPADLLIAAAAEQAEVPLVHHDADYPLIAEVSNLRQRWFVPQGSLA